MAKAFGLKDPLLSQEVIPTVDASTGKNNPNANTYGVALDLLSHLVNTQKTPSTEAMAASLAQNLTLDKDGKFQVTSNLPVDLNQAANSAILQHKGVYEPPVIQILTGLNLLLNHIPVRTDTLKLSEISVFEDSANSNTVSLGLSGITYGPGGDTSEANQNLTYTITGIPSSITLWKLTGSTQVKSGDTLSLTELQDLSYKTVADANNNVPAYVTWTVTDNGNPPASLTESLSVTIFPVNDAPTAADNTITMLEDGTRSFTAADFGFADAVDSPPNAFSAVIITTLPTAGNSEIGRAHV